MASETSVPTRAFGLPQKPALDVESNSEWPAWIEHFGVYRFATGLNDKTGDAQVRTLLCTIGRKHGQIFSLFYLSPDDAMNIDFVKKSSAKIF